MIAPALEQLVILFTFLLIGFILGRSRVLDAGQSKVLSVLCVNLFLPCTIFNSFSTSFTVSNLRQYSALILSSVAILAVLLALMIPLSRALTRDAYRRLILAYSLIVPNFSYAGYAMAEGLFGSEGLLHLILFSIPVSLLTYTVFLPLLTRQKVTLKKLCNPVNVSIVLGIVVGLTGWRVAPLAATIITKGANCLAPTSMLLGGLVISEFKLKRLPFDFATLFTCAARLVIVPALMALVLRPLGNELLTNTAVVMYAMPCGLNTIVFPKLVGEDCSTGAALALISNSLALATIPLCLSLI